MTNLYIVDDSKVIRDRLHQKLTEKLKSLQIEIAEDVSKVKLGLQNFSPDVMIIDIHLKEGTGFDILKLINDVDINPLTIVLTNYAIPPYKEKALNLGADYFFDKSNEFDKAIEVIEKFVNEHSLEGEK